MISIFNRKFVFETTPRSSSYQQSFSDRRDVKKIKKFKAATNNAFSDVEARHYGSISGFKERDKVLIIATGLFEKNTDVNNRRKPATFLSFKEEKKSA